MSAPTQDAATSMPTRQQARASARHRNRLSQARFAGYLAATAGCCGLATTADAEIVQIDISAFAGQNGGLPVNGIATLTNWAGSGTGTLSFLNELTSTYNGNKFWGLYTQSGVNFAVTPAGLQHRDYFPAKFNLGSSVGSSATFSNPKYGYQPVFQNFRSSFNYTMTSPDFGPNSFMGFRFGSENNWNYGYLEVTWNSATTTWQVLSGAYESTPNTSILTPAPVPEPGAATMAFGALASLCLGGRALKRWKQQRQGEPRRDDQDAAHDLPQTAA